MSSDSEIAEVGRALKELAKERKRERYEAALNELPLFETFLTTRSLRLYKSTDYHWQVRNGPQVVADVWPSTSKFRVRGQKATKYGGLAQVRNWIENAYDA